MNEYMKKIDLDTVEGNKKRSVKAFNEFIDLLIEEGYELKSEYVKNNIKVTLKPLCGHNEYEVTPSDFKNNRRCPECAKKKRRETKKENSKKRFVNLLTKEGYEMLGEYVGVHFKVTQKCNKGHIYSAAPHNFIKGHRCPHCNIPSYGEELTQKLLDQYNIVFEREKVFDGLTGLGGKSLRFDFYMPEHNVIIEINGEGHYKEYTNNFLNDNIIRHDKIKRDFCKKQGIKLYDIEYLSTVIGKNNALKHVEERVLEIIRGIAA